MKNIFTSIHELQQQGQSFVLCTLTGSQGSVPRKAGSKMIVLPDGSTLGSVGGGAMEKEVVTDALDVLQNGNPEHKKYFRDELHENQQPTWVTIFFEPVWAQGRLFIFGAGHVGASLAKFAKETGFECILVDPRPELIRELRVPGIRIVEAEYLQQAHKADVRKEDFVFITTFSHETDRQLLAEFAHRPMAWLGMIGSERKAQATREFLLKNNLATAEQIGRIEMPAGIALKVETPAEIAISILARIIHIKNSNKH